MKIKSGFYAVIVFCLAGASCGENKSGGRVLFRFPAVNTDGKYFSGRDTIGIDHDPVEQEDGILGNAICKDFKGRAFPYCYDGHKGTDFILKGGFETMDAGSTDVVAAADGTVLEAVDGNYDRCHAAKPGETGEDNGIWCDGNPVKPNYVIIQHGDGLNVKYYHLKKGSVVVSAGQKVRCGDKLGLVGSAGISSMPHLHFQVQKEDGTVVEPFAGEFSQPFSYWVQEDGLNGLPAERCR